MVATGNNESNETTVVTVVVFVVIVVGLGGSVAVTTAMEEGVSCT